MGRPRRVTTGGTVFHALNRANARMPIFRDQGDYGAFLTILAEAQQAMAIRLIEYTLMPNHWHLVLWPVADKHLSRFMHQLSTTHAKRWPLVHGASGTGHLYQGRFKSFPVQDDRHYLTVCRYVSRNPVRAGLVSRAEEWPWSSLHQRHHAKYRGRPALTEGPVALSGNWLEIVNEPQSGDDEEAIRRCVTRGRPFGAEDWVAGACRRFHLESSLRPPPQIPLTPPSYGWYATYRTYRQQEA